MLGFSEWSLRTRADDRVDRGPVRLPPRRGPAAEGRGAVARGGDPGDRVHARPPRRRGQAVCDRFPRGPGTDRAWPWSGSGRPSRARFLWALAALGPLAVGALESVDLRRGERGAGPGRPRAASRSRRAIVAVRACSPWRLPRPSSCCCRGSTRRQGANVMPWMRVYWAGAFPPRSPGPLLVWLVEGAHQPDVRLSRRRGPSGPAR